MITMLVGSTGAGKTTYGKELEKKLPGVLYSIDNWMKDLWGQDMPEDPQPDWFKENQEWYMNRIDRCERLIQKLVISRSQLNQNSILDLGFSTKSHRKKFIDLFKSKGVSCKIVWLDFSAEVRWNRVQERNLNRGNTFVMTVDQSLFDFMESIFEPPDDSEGCTIEVLN